MRSGCFGLLAREREFGGSGILQGLEAIGEVRVETSTSSARYNTPTSVIVTTRGGTNQVHGALFETHRNNGFGVARARQDVFFDGRPYEAPKLIRNEFGGSIGGPIVVPLFGAGGRSRYEGRNRTFFFISREGLELRQGITREFVVPTAAMRAGDFSGLIDSQGRAITLYDLRRLVSVRELPTRFRRRIVRAGRRLRAGVPDAGDGPGAGRSVG